MTLRSTRRRRQRENEARRQTTFDGACQVVFASVREMAQADVTAMIPAATLAEIRAVDPHPLFVALDTAQEGESTGEVFIDGKNAGPQKKFWSAAAIGEWVNKAKDAAVKGLARLWHGTSHDSKREIGKIVATAGQQIGGKAHAVTVGWIHDDAAKADFKAGKISTGSMEADLLLDRAGDGWLVRAVKAVQGVVLAGQGSQPGFAGAGVLASVQELETNKGKEELEMPPTNEPITLRDVKEFLEENQGVLPTQLFGLEQLLKLPAVADAMKAESKTAVDAAVKERDEQLAKLKPDAEKWARHSINEASKDLIAKSALLKDVTKGVAAFVQKALGRRLDLAGVPEAERQAKVDAEVKAELDFVKEAGIVPPEPKTDDKAANDKASGGDQTPSSDPKDMTDPKNNDLIP